MRPPRASPGNAVNPSLEAPGAPSLAHTVPERLAAAASSDRRCLRGWPGSRCGCLRGGLGSPCGCSPRVPPIVAIAGAWFAGTLVVHQLARLPSAGACVPLALGALLALRYPRDALGRVGHRGVCVDRDCGAAASRRAARGRSGHARRRDPRLRRRISDARPGAGDVLVRGGRAAAGRSAAARAAHVVRAAAADRGRRAARPRRAPACAARCAQSRRFRLRAVVARDRARRDGLRALGSARGRRAAELGALVARAPRADRRADRRGARRRRWRRARDGARDRRALSVHGATLGRLPAHRYEPPRRGVGSAHRHARRARVRRIARAVDPPAATVREL